MYAGLRVILLDLISLDDVNVRFLLDEVDGAQGVDLGSLETLSCGDTPHIIFRLSTVRWTTLKITVVWWATVFTVSKRATVGSH